MNKAQVVIVSESFRSSVMLSVNTMDIDPDLKALLLIEFQTFYLSMIQKLLASPPPPDLTAQSAN
jgi:hypothetical protein